MAIIELFSKRKRRRELQGKPDVYQYDHLSGPLRVQIGHIWRSALGAYWRGHSYSIASESPACKLWELIHNSMAREKGVWSLGERDSNPADRCLQYLMSADTDGTLDIIELSFRVIDRARDSFWERQANAGAEQDADGAINELNGRFREHGVGYQYVEGEIVRVDSQFLHSETVKPALALLNDAGFSGPTDEFMRAFDHHRKGQNKDAIADALSAFESTMKAICVARRWTYGPKDTAKPLLDIIFNNGLIPSELQTHFAGLRAAMESGLPTLANRTSRHGQGATPAEVPEHYVAYALHLMASNIVFLVECHKNKK